MSRTFFRYALAGAAVLGGAALTACGSAAGIPSAGQTSVSAAPTSAGPSATVAASAPASASAAAACASASLSVTVVAGQGGAAAGSVYYPVDFTNTGSTACTLLGYPGVSFVTGSSGGGAAIGAPATRGSGAPPATVTLPPGGDAHAVLQVVDAGNYSPAACHPVTAHRLRVYPPGQTRPLYAPLTAQVCSAKLPANLGSPLGVYPVRAGKGQMGQAP